MTNPSLPKSVSLNLLYRRKVMELGYSDPAYARAICRACADDPLLFFNLCVWILESRDAAEWQSSRKFGKAKELPFITRPYQDRIVKETLPLLGNTDVPMIKSREMGASYIYVALAVWDWCFHQSTHIGLVSKDLDAADNPDDPDSLMSKVMFIVERLPVWMVGTAKHGYDRNLSQHTLRSLRNNSTIRAYAATGELGRGGRKRWMLFDEFHAFPAGDDAAAMDSTAYVTNCRVIISTVNRRRGASGAFHEIVTSELHNGYVIDLGWQEDEEKSIGLYRSDFKYGGSCVLEILDKAFWEKYANGDGTYRHPRVEGKNYDFMLDGKTRSLYYDWCCKRPRATPQSIAAELDRSFSTATAQVIQPDVIEQALRDVKPIVTHAEIYRDPEDDKKWIMDTGLSEGSVKLWINLDENGRPPKDDAFSMGADVALGGGGTYSSYSCLQIFNRVTGEHVLEWRSNRVNPIEFANMAVFVAKLFNDAYIVPEFTGPGNMFVKELIALKYTANVYRRRDMHKRFAIKSNQLGYDNRDGGESILLGLAMGLKTGKAHVNSTLALREAGRYFYRNEKVCHASALSEEDQSARGKAHGDAAIALAVAWLGVLDGTPVPTKAEPPPKIPQNCFAARRAAWEARERQKGQRSYWAPYR